MTIRVFLADDQELVRSGFRMLIEAEDGLDALRVLQEQADIDLLIVDHSMPGMSGFELVKMLRQKLKRSELSILGLSADTKGSLSALFIKHGADDFLRKPFCPEELNCRVMFILERHEMLQELKKAALWNEVKDKLNQSGSGLSGGQQQRLCIARGIAIKPEVLLLDEPCSALDPISTGKIEELIHELKSKFTIVIVTHSMQQAARVSDRTAFFYMGRLIEVGPTAKLFTRPENKQTEDYITGRFG